MLTSLRGESMAPGVVRGSACNGLLFVVLSRVSIDAILVVLGSAEINSDTKNDANHPMNTCSAADRSEHGNCSHRDVPAKTLFWGVSNRPPFNQPMSNANEYQRSDDRNCNDCQKNPCHGGCDFFWELRRRNFNRRVAGIAAKRSPQNSTIGAPELGSTRDSLAWGGGPTLDSSHRAGCTETGLKRAEM